ncbi:hypothetical protein [Mycolicibacterium chlorophenolicum]|uniref:Uncharacterized protein n=1 Tax=Mycolicibacterium chlorophenolicum TaxID=37916 RepID=A0A0J6WHC4_9MYCO|nr:hypothetical protein [Mycolicibacterium chlorophenolicum]KMO82660.1 hypothetical protein MCHLDSM_01283 [Mycolicibacterium chlorophenolicum]
MRAPEHDPVQIAEGVWVHATPLDIPDDFPNPEPHRYVWQFTGTPEHDGHRTTYFPAPQHASAIRHAAGETQFHHASSVEAAVEAAREIYARALNEHI